MKMYSRPPFFEEPFAQTFSGIETKYDKMKNVECGLLDHVDHERFWKISHLHGIQAVASTTWPSAGPRHESLPG